MVVLTAAGNWDSKFKRIALVESFVRMKSQPWPNVSDAIRKVMQANKGKDTRPELIVRRLVHRMGYRYRLHRKDLPGRPDLVFGPRRKVIFVHGCFWHQHSDPNCSKARRPKSRVDFWNEKFAANSRRDSRNVEALTASGWSVLVLWECELRHTERLVERVVSFLGE
ncbi:very short patch repair endonuclease [Methylobacterium sp. NMS12]|uniref:very short patch repair endonuclease n=1 Tax=Methylobacterium sp. NMS12 TaxID=3079766 RepID=UPI003F881861